MTDLRIEMVEQLSDTAEGLYRAIHDARTYASRIALTGGDDELWWRLWADLDLAQALVTAIVHARPTRPGEAELWKSGASFIRSHHQAAGAP